MSEIQNVVSPFKTVSLKDRYALPANTAVYKARIYGPYIRIVRIGHKRSILNSWIMNNTGHHSVKHRTIRD